jgi:TonB dependent receptor-like, beta-barrel
MQSALNIGSRKERFYFQAGVGFVDMKPYVKSGGELQSDSHHRDLNTSMKFGFTPNVSDSYVFSYHYQDGTKGVPAYAGEDPSQRIRYWEVPLRSYDDGSYSSQDFRSSFTSIYDDETIGSVLLYTLKPGLKHLLKTAFLGHSVRSFNLLGGIEYDAGQNNSFIGNFSRKSRFPTMKDRYSYRLVRSIPNPDLQSEASWNLDLGYAWLPDMRLHFKTPLFYSHLQNTIQADFRWNPVSSLKTGLQYTLTERKNLSHAEILFTHLPKHKLYGFINHTFFPSISEPR